MAREATTGADLFVRALELYGVEYLFGNPGTTELPVMRALERSDVDYMLALHEDIAMGMASGYASVRRYRSESVSDVNPVGVVNLHVTPGLAHGLGNLHEARFAGTPLLVTAGTHATHYQHAEPILSGDLVQMARQFTKWSAEVKDVDALPTMLRRAFRVALSPPMGPVFLALPLDVMMSQTDEQPPRLGPIPSAGRGDPKQVAAAAEFLSDADDPVMIVGDHVARSGGDAARAAVELAEASGVRVHGEMLASEINFPTDHDQWISFLPPIQPVAAKFMDTDTLLLVGCSTNTPTTSYEGELVSDDTTLVHVSNNTWEIGKNESVDCAVMGDPALVLPEIADEVESRISPGSRESRIQRAREMKTSTQEKLASMGTGDPENPLASKAHLVDSIRDVAPEARIVDESITTNLIMMNRGSFQHDQLISGKGGGLGYGLPAAIGAAIAESERPEPKPTIGFIGDGSYLYYPHALYTAARYGIDLTVVIPDNRNYRILKDNMLGLLGGSEDDYEFIGMDFEPAVDIPLNATSVGATAERVENPDDISSALERAIDTDGPAVVDVFVQD